jgi:anti-sigma regulatory factor (Ser/Thr protein kinase)
VLRSAVERLVNPGAVLEHVNNTLCPDIPPNMFVTCLYALLDPSTGWLRYANAGHNLPYQRTGQAVAELRARGMPLGLMPEMTYEEKEAQIAPGDQIIFYSDGIVEAHNARGEMFGFPRLRELLAGPTCAAEMIPCMVDALAEFTGTGWEQEDDVTFVSLARDPLPERQILTPAGDPVLAEFEIASQPGNEREAMQRVAEAAARLNLPSPQMERLKTAVAEAAMNAMEHGNHYQADQPVRVTVRAEPGRLTVLIRDHGGGQIIPPSEEPDLDAKLAGLQSPRGWGLFLIKNMVDEMHVTTDERYHTVELVMRLDTEVK